MHYLLQHHVDSAIGVYIIDRYTYYALEFLERVTPDSKQTMAQFVSPGCSGKLIIKPAFLYDKFFLSSYNSLSKVNTKHTTEKMNRYCTYHRVTYK